MVKKFRSHYYVYGISWYVEIQFKALPTLLFRISFFLSVFFQQSPGSCSLFTVFDPFWSCSSDDIHTANTHHIAMGMKYFVRKT